MPGGFTTMNKFVRETICHALQASNIHYEKTFKALVSELTAMTDQGEGESGERLPALLTSVRQGGDVKKS